MRHLAPLALLLLAIDAPPAAPELRGYASAYAPGRMDEVVRYRLDSGVWWNEPPLDWYTAAGYIATNNCAQVGSMAVLVDPAGREYRVLVADCGGKEPDGGAAWMTANNIVAELDWRLWTRLVTEHGRPLEISIEVNR